jgi:Flp pilus assembly protein TadD
MTLSLAKLLEPEKPSIRAALGRALFAIGQIARARREFAKVVNINPSDDWAHFALALACERTGQPARARGHLKLAVAMRPGEPEYERALRRIGGP